MRFMQVPGVSDPGAQGLLSGDAVDMSYNQRHRAYCGCI